MQLLKDSPLGKTSNYVSNYDPSLLFPLPRSLKREELGITTKLPFSGVDIWNAYEISWLNTKGKPIIALAEFRVPAETSHLVESKSFKLYLNSFTQSVFDNTATVKTVLTKDLSQATGGTVSVELFKPEQRQLATAAAFSGICLDELDISVSDYELNPKTLQATGDVIEETLYSHLLKSNCLATGQPDWGSVIIHYVGKQIDREGLLKYLISFRNHAEFHEQCVERIFRDIKQHCQPEKLTVYARYTRRGGLDINPFRSNFESEPKNIRTERQ